MNTKELNDFYCSLEKRKNSIISPFNKIHYIFKYEVGYFNGHYTKDETGEYQMDYFPIPVISITGFCDIEINIDSISLSTKLTRVNALNFNYAKLQKYHFEVYGVKDYLSDFYLDGFTIDQLKNNILNSKEEEIGFAFTFDKNIDGDELYNFVKWLRRNGFYY